MTFNIQRYRAIFVLILHSWVKLLLPVVLLLLFKTLAHIPISMYRILGMIPGVAHMSMIILNLQQ